jgi:DNA-binding MarR family transcriptional regulator
MPEKNLPSTFYRVLRLHQLVGSVIETALQPAGLSANQYTVLSLIRIHAPVSSAEIARKLSVTAQSAGESIKALEARELVVRTLVPENRRTHALDVTTQGRRALTRADKLVLAAEDRFFADLSTQERTAFEDTIQRLRRPVQAVPAVRRG